MTAVRVPLSDVVATAKLRGRNSRAPNLTLENDALHRLARAVTKDPLNLIEDILSVAVRVCDADSAGLSVYDRDKPGHFRLLRVTGRMSKLSGTSVPIENSIGGFTLSTGETQLLTYPERHFLQGVDVSPSLVELLIVPVAAESAAFGALWIVSHGNEKFFDLEDVRVMNSLAAFAALAARSAGVPAHPFRAAR